MIPFSELTELANKISRDKKDYVSISLRHACLFANKRNETSYFFYNNGERQFNTAQELRLHMENILNPPVDEGVEVE
jgi:hypothetical protein